ncbi:MAG: acyltransferase [Pseudomonadota bacterium]|nr:acyltransferase [Pseudomonadota bacterium]
MILWDYKAHATTRLGQLDGLRGLAACAVAFLYHPQALFTPAALADAGPLLGWFHRFGWTLVDLFFVLSGYLFAHVYRGGLVLQDRDAARRFAFARVARLYPLHLVMLMVCAALFFGQPGNTALAFAGHLMMLQDFLPAPGQSFDGPAWSISVECVCYALFMLGASAGQVALRRLSWVLGAGALALLAWRGLPGGPWDADDLLRGLAGFFVGQLVWRGRNGLERVPSAVLIVTVVAGLVLADGPWSAIPPLTLLTWPAALLLALRLPQIGSAPLLWLGSRSYAIYLIHEPVIALARRWFGILDGGLGQVLAAHLALVVVVLALSDLALRMIERPAQRAILIWCKRRDPLLAAA